MKIIKVVEVLGTPCLLAPEHGQTLLGQIKSTLGPFGSVKVDFSGYQFLSTAFLNHSFGQICIDQNWDAKRFWKKIQIVQLQDDDMEEVRLAVDNAQLRMNMVRHGIKPEEFYSAHLRA